MNERLQNPFTIRRFRWRVFRHPNGDVVWESLNVWEAVIYYVRSWFYLSPPTLPWLSCKPSLRRDRSQYRKALLSPDSAQPVDVRPEQTPQPSGCTACPPNQTAPNTQAEIQMSQQA